MRVFYLLSVWLHIVAAMVWIGGMAFLGLVLVPAIRQAEYRGVAATFIQWTGRRFRAIGWVCLGMLILTGTFNLFYRGFGWTDLTSRQLWQTPFGQILGTKLLLIAATLLLLVFHDFVIGPRAASLLQANPDLRPAMQLRLQASWLGRLVLLLGLVAVALGVMLVRGSP